MTFPSSRLRGSADELPDVPRAPWSEIGPDFQREWGRPGGKVNPEHLEVLGLSGSGKSYFQARILQDRVRARGAHVVFIATKPADETIVGLGWPIVDDWRGVQQNPQCIFWPRTSATGKRREAYHERKIQDLLDRLWHPESNTIVVFDEVAYIQGLSPDLAKTVNMYLREGRSSGITLIMGKQRPQGVTREMHANTKWVVTFAMADRDDAERAAQLFGSKREWTPIIESLDADRFEFLIKCRRTGTAYISWIDVPLKPVERKRVALTA